MLPIYVVYFFPSEPECPTVPPGNEIRFFLEDPYNRNGFLMCIYYGDNSSMIIRSSCPTGQVFDGGVKECVTP